MSKLRKKSREVLKVQIIWNLVGHCKKLGYYSVEMENHLMDLSRVTLPDIFSKAHSGSGIENILYTIESNLESRNTV